MMKTPQRLLPPLLWLLCANVGVVTAFAPLQCWQRSVLQQQQRSSLPPSFTTRLYFVENNNDETTASKTTTTNHGPPLQSNDNHTSSLLSSADFEAFVFAPNGFCLQPKLFVDNNNNNNNDPSSATCYFRLRNVPGDGDCLFLAVALAMLHASGLSGEGLKYTRLAADLRRAVAQWFATPQKMVALGETTTASPRVVSARALLQQAARDEGMSQTQEYLQSLVQPSGGGSLHGGGPELAVLSNLLRRPIAVYELSHDDDNKDDMEENDIWTTEVARPIHCVGTFGKGVFDDPLEGSAAVGTTASMTFPWTLYILIVDTNGRAGMEEERHAMVLLPTEVKREEG